MSRALPWILAAAGWMAAAYQSIRLFAAHDEIRLLRANARHCPERAQPARNEATMPARSGKTWNDDPERAWVG
jgi:hypothetical protein